MNHDDNLLTGPGAFNAGVPNGRQLALQSSGNGLLAPNSVNGKAFPSGQYTDGFPTSAPPAVGAPNYGQPLPVVSTSSVDLNIVDCPYLVENTPPGAYNPYALSNTITSTLPGSKPIDLQETAAEATTFLQQSFADSQPQY
jgi:hypothetical protein